MKRFLLTWLCAVLALMALFMVAELLVGGLWHWLAGTGVRIPDYSDYGQPNTVAENLTVHLLVFLLSSITLASALLISLVLLSMLARGIAGRTGVAQWKVGTAIVGVLLTILVAMAFSSGRAGTLLMGLAEMLSASAHILAMAFLVLITLVYVWWQMLQSRRGIWRLSMFWLIAAWLVLSQVGPVTELQSLRQQALAASAQQEQALEQTAALYAQHDRVSMQAVFSTAQQRALLDLQKLDAEGEPLHEDEDNWACVKDRATGLIWEVKTWDGGPQDFRQKFTFGGVGQSTLKLTHHGHAPNTIGLPADNFQVVTSEAPDNGEGWNRLVHFANANKLCGLDNWRVPNHAEILSLHVSQRQVPAERLALWQAHNPHADKGYALGLDPTFFPAFMHHRIDTNHWRGRDEPSYTLVDSYWTSTPMSQGSGSGAIAYQPFGESLNRGPLRDTVEHSVQLVSSGKGAAGAAGAFGSFSPDPAYDLPALVRLNDLVIDAESGLAWQACRAGMTFELGQGCQGTAIPLPPRPRFGELATLIGSLESGSDKRWRLPSDAEARGFFSCLSEHTSTCAAGAKLLAADKLFRPYERYYISSTHEPIALEAVGRDFTSGLNTWFIEGRYLSTKAIQKNEHHAFLVRPITDNERQLADLLRHAHMQAADPYQAYLKARLTRFLSPEDLLQLDLMSAAYNTLDTEEKITLYAEQLLPLVRQSSRFVPAIRDALGDYLYHQNQTLGRVAMLDLAMLTATQSNSDDRERAPGVPLEAESIHLTLSAYETVDDDLLLLKAAEFSVMHANDPWHIARADRLLQRMTSHAHPALPGILAAVDDAFRYLDPFTEGYEERNDGTVLDRATGLLWMRCALGLRWDGSQCLPETEGGASQFSAAELGQLNSPSFAGRSDWRLPTLMELNSLVYCRNGKLTTFGPEDEPRHSKPYNCHGSPRHPAIADAFPDVRADAAAPYWSRFDYPKIPYHNDYLMIDFKSGVFDLTSDKAAVRLVTRP